MADQFAAPPVNALISIQPLSTTAANRDATGVPPQLANLPTGTVVEGFVINRDAQSNPILRTALGDVLVKSDVFMKTGSEVVFRIDPSQAGAARIVTIDGMVPQEYVATNTRGMVADTISSTGQTLPPAPAVTTQTAIPSQAQPAPAMLSGVLVSAAPQPNASPFVGATLSTNPLQTSALGASTPIPAGLLKLQQGAQLQVRILQVTLPQALTGTAQNTTAPRTELLQTAVPTTTPRDGALQALQSGTDARTAKLAATPQEATAPTIARLNEVPGAAAAAGILRPNEMPTMPAAQTIATQVKVAQQAQNLPLPADSTASNTRQPPTPAMREAGIPAQVIGHEKDGALILRSAIGTVKLHAPQRLPIGTTVQLQMEPTPLQANAATSQSPVAEALKPLTQLALGWPALETALQSNDPALVRAIMQALPDAGGHKLASGLLFFISAVKAGDIRQWLGSRGVSALESRLPELAAKLKQDMGQLQQLLVESPLTHWNAALVPVLYQGQLEHARFFFRHEGERESQERQGKSGKDQRFIVEVDLSHLGEMQFDGFLRQQEQSKQFDLVVRSAQAVPTALEQQIRTTFEQAMQTTGLKGYLVFQPGSQHFVRPMANDDAPPPTGGLQPILA